MKESISVSDNGTTFTVLLSRRAGAKYLRLSVTVGGLFRVSAPPGTSDDRIRSFLTENAAWLHRHNKTSNIDSDGTITLFGEHFTRGEVPIEEIAAKARKIFSGRLTYYLQISGYTGAAPALSLRALKSRWGHFRPRDNEIMLNFALVNLPPELADYVIAHEVAHLFVRNHGADFYAFGEKLLPGFKKLDRELNKHHITFIS